MALFRFAPELDPINSLLSLQRELDQVFNRPPFGFDLGLSGRGVFPAVNVFRDKEGNYVVRLEAPGVAAENLNIECQGTTLTISGKREATSPNGGSFHRRERGSGQFSRSLQLPTEVDLAKAEASYKQGMLTIRIPKREEAKPRQITVQPA
jgi:HSP20 family protein